MDSKFEKLNHRSNGKLLLTGEYVVLDGAVSLAVPTTYGQSLTITPISDSKLIWESLDYQGKLWFESSFTIDEFTSISLKPNNHIFNTLLKILKAAKQLNPSFLIEQHGFKVVTKLDFPNNWGLGTSSTLINNISRWANIDSYKLLALSFGGSGYDIACANHNSAITYQLQTSPTHNLIQPNQKKRTVIPVNFDPSFSEHLYFVHLNKKQNSRDGIAHYNANKSGLSTEISEISDITSKIIGCTSLQDFNGLIETHEHIIGSIIKQVPVKNQLFKDFDGAVKSLGAWGGDFVLVSSEEHPKSYFGAKGFNTIISYNDMILKQ